MTRQIGRSFLTAMRLFVVSLFILMSSVQAAVPDNLIRIHYNRTAGDYAGWGLHIWGNDLDLKQEVSWAKPMMPSGQDTYGVYFDIPVKSKTGDIGFILHLGEEKNVPKNMQIYPAIHGTEVWQRQDDPVIYNAEPKVAVAAGINGIAEKQPAIGMASALVWPFLLALSLALLGASVLMNKRRQRQKNIELSELKIEFEQATHHAQKEREERQAAEQRLLQMANYDELTNLPNRAILNQTIAQALSKAKRYGKQLAILFIDLDRFKLINDTMGHSAGDTVLKEVAERFKQCLRESDTIARLGGDEFVVLLEDITDTKDIAGVAQKLVDAAQKSFLLSGQECNISASIGISAFPSDGKDAEVLIKNADIAMYRAKEQGKNNFQYYAEQMNMHLLQRLALESSLRHAVARNELRVHYQPIVDVASLQILGVEALVRWQHPDMGMVGPLQFIPIAEETGLIVEIGRWVLETACRQGAAWRNMGCPVKVSVNLSPRQLSEPDIVEQFSQVLAQADFPASSLILEITENLMLNNPDESVIVLQELKDLGVRIAIDDFGTGYSSLAYLRRFPIDILKIDRSFVQDISADPDSYTLTAAVIALSKSLGLKVVAEGVETDEQRHFLLEQKCERMQGYWFCKPKPADDITALLKKQAPLP